MSTLRNKMIQQMQLKGYAERTITSYVECIKSLSKYYSLSPDLISVEQVRGYIQKQLNEKGISKSWVNQTISALKILFCQVLKREWNSVDIPRVRREKKLPVVFAKEEVGRILNSLRNVKHKAMLTLAYSSGLRLGELRTLKVSDIDSKRMLVRVRQGKGFKDRYTILSPVALELLRTYWKMYNPADWLFVSRHGGQLSDRTIQGVFKKALKQSGVGKSAGMHSLRHSFATHLMEQGVSLPIIQQLLGHRSLRTTSVYLHVQQYSVFAVKSPLDSLSL